MVFIILKWVRLYLYGVLLFVYVMIFNGEWLIL